MKKLIILIIFIVLISVNVVVAYPTIISNKNTNHTLNKEVVYSIPQKHWRYVEEVEFVSNPIKCVLIDNYGQMECKKGWYQVFWDKNHICKKGRILIYPDNYTIKTILHELGHIYKHCVLKKVISTEEFADNFRLDVR